MSGSPVYILSHGNCMDGHGAAWAAWKRLGDSAQYIPVSYGDPPPAVPDNSILYLLDFSYKRPVLDGFLARGIDVRIIDHHKSAQEDLADFPGAIFDMDKSGAMLAWEHFHPDGHAPTVIHYIQDRDMWWWKLPDSREISAALWSYPMDFPSMDRIHKQLQRAYGRQKFVEEGAAILRCMEMQTMMICRQARPTTMDGHEIPIVNATSLWSEVGELLLRMYPTAPFAAAYADTREGLRKYSLRSRGDFDVSAVARIHGGGGHPSAAGFAVRLPE